MCPVMFFSGGGGNKVRVVNAIDGDEYLPLVLAVVVYDGPLPTPYLQ